VQKLSMLSNFNFCNLFKRKEKGRIRGETS